MIEKSCGTIPYTIKDGTIYYHLLKALDDGYCGFPKGHIESGESEEETALRETWEETSIKPILNSAFRYEISYRMDNGNDKTVVYFLADFKDQTPAHNDGFEKHQYLILPFEEALGELTFDNSKEMLKSANEYLLNTKRQ